MVTSSRPMSKSKERMSASEYALSLEGVVGGEGGGEAGEEAGEEEVTVTRLV